MSNRLALVLFALCATLAIGTLACGGSSSPRVYTGTDVVPTYPAGSGFPTIENRPIPTVTSRPTVTASGLQIFDVVVGTGDGAQPDSIVYVNYTLWVNGGNEIDRNRLAPVRYRLTKGQAVDGLVEGLTGMALGGKRRLIIPPALAYGSSGSGDVIPPNATLIYDIERVAPPGQATASPSGDQTPSTAP